MLLFLIITVLVITVLAVSFAIQNAGIILLSFLIWQFKGSLAVVLLLTFFFGFIIGLLIILPKLIKRNMTVSNQNKKIEELQKSLTGKDESKTTKE